MEADLHLLRAYTDQRDAEAFARIVQRHAGMVHAVCLRVTRNQSDADDATQESFLELARQARRIRSNLAAWLHRVAHRRACRIVQTRARQAERFPALCEEGTAEADPVVQRVDAALDACDDNKTRTADLLGITRTTLSKRLRLLCDVKREWKVD
ncbi:MAG: RNA polymerase sigma factor [Planctomycetota bacterium]